MAPTLMALIFHVWYKSESLGAIWIIYAKYTKTRRYFLINSYKKFDKSLRYWHKYLIHISQIYYTGMQQRIVTDNNSLYQRYTTLGRYTMRLASMNDDVTQESSFSQLYNVWSCLGGNSFDKTWDNSNFFNGCFNAQNNAIQNFVAPA